MTLPVPKIDERTPHEITIELIEAARQQAILPFPDVPVDEYLYTAIVQALINQERTTKALWTDEL